MTLGILAAMHDEIACLIADMTQQPGHQIRNIGMRDYHIGHFEGQPCVVVLARMGKVAAAATAVTLIREFGVTEVLFLGLAGGLGPQIRVGDMVIADCLLQHDLDARPFFPRHEVPLLGLSEILTHAALAAELGAAAQAFLDCDLQAAVGDDVLEAFGIGQAALHAGMIISGDQFIDDAREVAALQDRLPGALAVEMEGAAVAQICHEYAVSCAVLRTISDRADASAHVDFGKFLSAVASHYSAGVLRRFFAQRKTRLDRLNRIH